MSSTDHRPRWTRLLPELTPHTSARQLGTLLPLLTSTPIANMGMTSVPSLSDLPAAVEPKPPSPVIVFGSTFKTCAVCLEDYLPGDRLRLLDACGHLFHVKCIDPWLDSCLDVSHRRQRGHPLCPVCKTPVLGLCAAKPQDSPRPVPTPVAEERRQPSANIQLIDVSVHQSWAEWFQSLLKLYYDGQTNHDPMET